MSTASTTIGGNYNGHDTRQTTSATLGNGNVKVGGQDIADTNIEVNRDVENAQEITQDYELGGLDASVTVDHRLVSEEGRKSIKKDIIDTTQHAKEIGQAIDDITSTDIGLVDGIKNVDKYAKDRIVLADKAMSEDAQKALKGEEGAQGSENELQQLSDALSKEEGLAENTDVNLYDGSQTPDDTPLESANDFNKEIATAGYHENGEQGGNDVYLNIDKTDMTDSSDVVKSLVHEQERHSQAQNNSSLSDTDQTTLATNRGNQAQDTFNAYSDLAGIDTKSTTTTQKDWNTTNRSSQNVVDATEQMRDRVQSEEVKPLLPLLVFGAGLVLGNIESANAPDVEEEPTDETRSVIPKDWLVEAGTELAKENTPNWADPIIDGVAMVGLNPVQAVKDGLGIVGGAFKKGDKDITSSQQNTLTERYTENTDGTITGPNGGQATPTGVHDIETQQEINKRESGGYYVENDGKQEVVGSPYEHGNTHNKELTEIYIKRDVDGNYEKTGITKDSNTRYSQEELNGGDVEPIGTRPRDRAAEIERFMVERKLGPQNKELWAGKRDPLHENYDPNYKPPHMNKSKIEDNN
jgi:hypothetical protein